MTDFTAKEPSLGYFYQTRYGLLLLLSFKQNSNIKLLMENLDDIEIQYDDQDNLFQTKYHQNKKTNLTDRSSDFWKTIRIWCDHIINEHIDIDKTIFTLITTENISTSSIIYDLKNKTNINGVLQSLNDIAKETSNEENKMGYKAFIQLSLLQQQSLINNIFIVDSSINFIDIDNKIKAELRLSTSPDKINLLLENLDGWWLQQCILHLQNAKKCITFEELQYKIWNITDHFRQDNLPNNFPERILVDESKLTENESMTFIKQLKIIDVSKRSKQNSISDYYRAFEQRSKWLRADLLNPQEEIDYDNRIIDDWRRKFDLLLDDNENNSDEEKKKSGNKFYRNFYCDNIPQIFIRERFKESYLVLGSCHMLSDKKLIGWHPEYKKKLKED